MKDALHPPRHLRHAAGGGLGEELGGRTARKSGSEKAGGEQVLSLKGRIEGQAATERTLLKRARSGARALKDELRRGPAGLGRERR